MPRPMRGDEIEALVRVATACCEQEILVRELEARNAPECAAARLRLARLEAIVASMNDWSETERQRARMLLDEMDREHARAEPARLPDITGGNQCFQSAGGI